MHEAQMHEENCFVTLTYDNENIPQNGSLVLRDFQDFIRRLRKNCDHRIRYYHCGEYGDRFARPHYHALLFNHDFEDRKLFSERNGISVYTSEDLSRLWTKGFSTVGDVTFESAAYVARYVIKKVTGKKADDHYGSRAPEYTTMSRRPGIGKTWYEKFKTDVYPLDRVVIRGNFSRPPRFYDSLLGDEDPSTLALIKINREKNSNFFVDDVLSNGRKIKVNDSDDVRLRVKEICKKAEISMLKRPLEG